MATDLTIPSKLQVLALINTENQINLDFTHIDLEVPASLENDDNGKNTSLVVQAKPNTGYTGNVTVKYDRLDLDGFSQYGDPIFEIPLGGGLPEIIEAFNTFYGVNLSLEDDIDSDLVVPEIDYAGKTFALTANPDSLAYRGEIEVNVRFPSQLSGLATELASTPVPIMSQTASVIDDAMYVYGGMSGSSGGNYNTLYRYDFLTDTWSTRASDVLRTYHAAGVVDGKLYVFGSNIFDTRDTYSIYDPEFDTWTSGSQNMPRPMHYHKAAVINREIYLFGLGLVQFAGELYKYNVDADTFTQLAMGPPANSLAMTAYNDKLYVAGGREGSLSVTNLRSYDPATDTWTELAPMPRAAVFAELVTIADHLYLFGGRNAMNAEEGTLLRYDPTTDSWFDYGDLGIGTRAFHAMVAYKQALYIVGGSDSTLSEPIPPVTTKLIKIA